MRVVGLGEEVLAFDHRDAAVATDHLCAVAGAVDDLHAWLVGADALAQIEAAHAAWHDHIGDHELDVLHLLLPDIKCLQAIGCLQKVESEAGEELAQDDANGFVVLHNESSATTTDLPVGGA